MYTHKSVKSASIKLNHENQTTTLPMTKTQCPKDEIGYIWEAKFSVKNTSTAQIQYKYLVEKKRKGSIPIDSLRRAEPRSTNYDSFREKDDSHFSERATICYSKWLFETVNKCNLNAYMSALKSMNFDFQPLDSNVLKKFLTWIFVQETKGSVPKCLYLGALLALVNENNAFDWQKKSDEHSCKPFVDHFLDVLRSEEAVSLWDDVKETLLNPLSLLAPKLVNASSVPKWLSYATSFYSYFGMEQILSDSYIFNKGREYSHETYKELVEFLSQLMNAGPTKRSQKELLKILEKILFDAPDIDAVLSLYDNNAFLNLFHTSKEQAELFGKVLIKKAKDILTHNKGRLSEALTEISKIPPALLEKSIKAFSQILLHFIELPHDSSSQVNEENASAFCNEISQKDHFSVEEIISVIHALVMSNQPDLHGIFVRLLKTSGFYETWWNNFSRDQHISILSKWLTVDLADNQNQPSQCKPHDLFKRAAELETLNLFSYATIQQACLKGFERKKKNQNNFSLASMLEGLAIVEGLSPCIQDCYTKLFGSLLENPFVAKDDIISCSGKKCWFTDSSPNSLQNISR